MSVWVAQALVLEALHSPVPRNQLQLWLPDHPGQQYAPPTRTRLLRNIYHYWYRLGEALAVRQMLESTDLLQFVGGFTGKID